MAAIACHLLGIDGGYVEFCREFDPVATAVDKNGSV